jgi:hypothetical protein
MTLKIRIILIIQLLLGYSLANGQNDNAYYQVSDLYHQRARTFSCEFVKGEIDKIKLKRIEEIQAELQQQSESLLELSQETEVKEDKKALKQLAQTLTQTSAQKDAKTFYVKALESICTGVRAPVQYGSRGIGLANAAIINTAALPFSSLFSFLKGVFDRDKKDLGKRTDFLYRVMGPKRGVPSYVLGLLAFEAPNLMTGFNPLLMVINASVAIEMITNYQCLQANPADVNKIEFCETYYKLKDFYHRRHEASYRSGKKLQQLIEKGIVTRREKISTEAFCQFSRKEQVQRARAALKRASHLDEDAKIFFYDIILPIHKNRCTKILIQAKDQDDLNEIKKGPTALEGIEVVYKIKKEYLNEYYYTSEELNVMPLDEQLCHDVERNNLSKYAFNKARTFNNFLKASLAPSMLGTPESQKIVIQDNLINEGKVGGLKNLIFSIGPGEGNLVEVAELKAEKKLIIKKVKNVYKKIMRHREFNSCKQFVKRKDIDLIQLRSDFQRLTEISTSDLLKKDQELNAIKSFVRKVRRRLKLNWELISTNNLMDITTALNSREVANIIILSHGKNSGHLVDVFGQELPREAFTNISPTILSLNFYSCFSRQLLKLYNLQEKISAQMSFYKIRYLTSVQENDFMDGNNFAPIAAFGDYLYQLDRYLYSSTRGATALQETFGQELDEYQEPTMCTVGVADVKIRRGSYAVSINDKLIGTLSDAKNPSEIEFPCDYLTQGVNNLKIKNIVNTGGSEIENLDDFEITVEDKVLTKKDSTLRKNSFVTFKFEF